MSCSRIVPLVAAVCAALCSCGDRAADKDMLLPRREAYPRLMVYDSIYTVLDSLPLHIEVNSFTIASVERRENGIFWITQSYPAYGIAVYYTITPVSERSFTQSLGRSLGRMADNNGSAPVKRYEALSQSGFMHFVALAQDINLFPVQFVSTDKSRWVISAAATYTGGTLPLSYDSIAPVLRSVERDMVHTLNTLSYGKD